MIKHKKDSKAIPTDLQGNQGSPETARTARKAVDNRTESNIINFPISSHPNLFLPDLREEIAGGNPVAETPRTRLEALRRDLVLVENKQMTLEVLKKKHNLKYEYKTYDNHKQECAIVSPDFNKFIGFLKYIARTIGLRPTDKHTLDIVNRKEGFIPFNLRWALKATQAKNQSNNKIAKYADKLPWLQDEIAEWEIEYRKYAGTGISREWFAIDRSERAIIACYNILDRTNHYNLTYKKMIKGLVMPVYIDNGCWEIDEFDGFTPLTKEEWNNKKLEYINHHLRLEKTNKLLGHVPRKDIYCKRRGGLGLRTESAIYDLVGDSQFNPGGIAIDDKYNKE